MPDGDGALARQSAAPVPRERTGRNPIERKAVLRVQSDIAAMPASLVVQLALWPDEIAAWARSEGTSESLVYNMLARRKPYARMRERLARRLDVALLVLDHLIEAARPLPLAKRAPPPEVGDLPPGPLPSELEPIDWSVPPYPMHRDGTNPVERQAVRRVALEIASFPASAVVGLALWPETVAAWSREHHFKASVVSATLAGSPSERVRFALARRLDVRQADVDALIAGIRREPRATLPPEPPADTPIISDLAPPPSDPSPPANRSTRSVEFPSQLALEL
jgi:hypothetical protein